MIVNKRISLSLPVILSAVLLFLASSIVTAEQIVVSGADSVWNLELTPVSPDVIDSTDAPEENLITEAFVSHADSVLNLDLTLPSPDVLDSGDTPSENLITEAFVSHADSIWTTGLEKTEWNQKWSFAIITDLHIGRGYPDYDGQGFEDGYSGEDYYLTKRLKNVVKWINDNKNNIDCDGAKCPIQFLVVLGDIADSAEKSEFLKAKEILDKLNDPNNDGNTSNGIPYVPLFGNHDVWPYTKSKNATSALGERYFDQIFWDENATNTKLMKERLNFQRDEVHKNYKNFVFNYGKINFVGLDFPTRKKAKIRGTNPKGVIFEETEKWLKDRLNEYQGKEPVILLSHYPFAKDASRQLFPYPIPFPGSNFSEEEVKKLGEIIKEYEDRTEGKQVLANFAGHVHGYEEIIGEWAITRLLGFDVDINANYEYPKVGKMPVVTTEAIMVGSNWEKPRGIVRIVKINGTEIEDYNKWETDVEGAEHKEFVGLNPYFEFEYSGTFIGCVFFKADIFTKKKIISFDWDYGDRKSGKGVSNFHCYSGPGVYEVSLTITDESNNKESLTRKIEIPKEAIWPRIIKIPQELKEKIELISIALDKKVTEFGRTMKDGILIRTKPHSSSIPIGLITVHFEQATEDVNLTELVADSNLEKKKSILYMSDWPNVIEKSKILFVPK